MRASLALAAVVGALGAASPSFRTGRHGGEASRLPRGPQREPANEPTSPEMQEKLIARAAEKRARKAARRAALAAAEG